MSERPTVGPELAEAAGGDWGPPPQSPPRPPGPPPGHGPGGPRAGAAPRPPDPAPEGLVGPSLDPPEQKEVGLAELLYFGVLAPVPAMLMWSGQVWEVSIHVLTVEEENKVSAYVARQPSEQKVMGEAMLRVVYALREVNGSPVTFGMPTVAEELRAKMEWVSTWPATLLDAAIRAYAFATMQPVLRLQEMRDDPNSTAAPSSPS